MSLAKAIELTALLVVLACAARALMLTRRLQRSNRRMIQRLRDHDEG